MRVVPHNALDLNNSIRKDYAISTTTEQFTHFGSARLLIQVWSQILRVSSEREILEDALEAMLTPAITNRLPASMEFPGDYTSISNWVDDRIDEAQILCVHEKNANKLVGLVILWRDPDQTSVATIHVGYFFAESEWGKGYATETIKAVVSESKTVSNVRLLAGLDRDNLASVGVLKKSGFTEIPEQATKGRLFFEHSAQ